jgi:NAD(P)H-hydrate epimerase
MGINQRLQIHQPIVSAQQMQAIETRLFTAGMPVAALMEKVGGLIAQRMQSLYPLSVAPKVGVLVGPGHNGADALVVARELALQGYSVQIYHPFTRSKELTAAHAQFAQLLSIPFCGDVTALATCDVLLDGFFGFGLERQLEGEIAATLETINGWSIPVVSIDIPSGLHTDTGEVLGIALRATHTLCLGLWKLGLCQDSALPWTGQLELVDFGIPWSVVTEVLGAPLPVQRLTTSQIVAQLPLVRERTTHKYRQGHLLLIGGSQRYVGSVMLAGLGARATGVGMLTLLVPASIKPLVVARLPDAVVIAGTETAQGALERLPSDLDLNRFDAIAYGPGVTTESPAVLEQTLQCNCPLILDADGLNLLVDSGLEQLKARTAPTVLTPHAGEFQRLFPSLATTPPITAAQQATQAYHIWMVRKGACTVIASPSGPVWVNTESTPALARGGSGDVLTGLMGGLVAQAMRQGQSLEVAVQNAVWWHSQAGCWAAEHHTIMGVNAETLADALLPTLKTMIQQGSLNRSTIE